jgi:hypothetical protein
VNNFKNLLLVLIVFSIYTPLVRAEIGLKTFVTDNCTMFVDGTLSKPTLWKDCCVEHDLRYWFGGSTKSRDYADLQLKSCVNKKAGTFYSNLIYYGVRAGHHSPIKHKYSWGWGWFTKRLPYTKLTNLELEVINYELDQLEFSQEYIDAFKKRYLPR